MATTENALGAAPPATAGAAPRSPTVAAVTAPTPATVPAAPKAAVKKVAARTAPGRKTTAGKAATPPAKKPAKPMTKTLTKPLSKPVAKAAAKAAPKPKAVKPAKEKKAKLVRDSFTIPKDEYGVLNELKQRAGKLAMPIKKSELLRAGIKALTILPDSAFLAALKAVPTIKTGRPAQS